MKVTKLNCPNCNAKIKKGQPACEYCGTTLEFEETERPAVILATEIDPTRAQTEEQKTTPDTPPTEPSADAIKASQEITKANKITEKKHRIASSIVSAITGVAGIATGIILLDKIVYVSVALLALGILSLFKIFYTFMRSTYNMTPAGYIYSGMICALISGFSIYGGVEMIVISATLEGKILCIIPFLLAAVSISYFVIKTVYFIKERKGSTAPAQEATSAN